MLQTHGAEITFSEGIFNYSVEEKKIFCSGDIVREISFLGG